MLSFTIKELIFIKEIIEDEYPDERILINKIIDFFQNTKVELDIKKNKD